MELDRTRLMYREYIHRTYDCLKRNARLVKEKAIEGGREVVAKKKAVQGIASYLEWLDRRLTPHCPKILSCQE